MKYYYKKNFDKKVLDWQTLLNNFNQSLIEGKQIKHNPIGFFVSHEAHKIPQLKKVLKKLDCKIAHLYFNITNTSKTFGKHKDNVDVWFWNCQGQTKWVMEDKESFILNPGDLIFVSKGIYHEVIPLTPRAGISMSKE
jgi:mannose-6-phosphate isomerase-like protein (cupin superfamily)